jgi:hypothetical protein
MTSTEDACPTPRNGETAQTAGVLEHWGQAAPKALRPLPIGLIRQAIIEINS